MQFRPAVYNSNKPLDKLYIFDPSLLMFISYTKGDLINNEGNGVETIRYNMTEEFNGQNVSMAFEQKYQIYGYNCFNCNTETTMEGLKIDG